MYLWKHLILEVGLLIQDRGLFSAQNSKFHSVNWLNQTYNTAFKLFIFTSINTLLLNIIIILI